MSNAVLTRAWVLKETGRTIINAIPDWNRPIEVQDGRGNMERIKMTWWPDSSPAIAVEPSLWSGGTWTSFEEARGLAMKLARRLTGGRAGHVDGLRCAYCRNKVTGLTHCESCGAPL